MTIAEEPVEIKKRVTVDVDSTLGGLMSLAMRVPDEVPHEAAIVAAVAYFACDHDHDEEPVDEDHEPREMLPVTLEWSA